MRTSKESSRLIWLVVMCVCVMLLNSTITSHAQDDKIRFAWFTDTQNLSFYKMYSLIPYVTPGTIYNSLCDKIKDDYKNNEIDYAVFTGDFVWDRNGTFDWVYSESAFNILLKNNVPHGVLAGNHDMNEESPITLESYKEYQSKFGQKKYKDKSWYGESFYDNIGHYDLVESKGTRFIIMYMSYGVSYADECMVDDINGNKVSLKEAAREWMNYNLKKYSDRKAILCFHDGLTGGGQIFGSLEEFMDSVIIKNDNIIMTLGGHFIGQEKYNSKVVYKMEYKKGVKKVYHLFHNYQELEANEAGYIRYIEMDPNEDSVRLYSYSPHTNKIIDEEVL